MSRAANSADMDGNRWRKASSASLGTGPREAACLRAAAWPHRAAPPRTSGPSPGASPPGF
eukprot:CAMPEP_0179179824 /NCGR_PEP_ID=MMETSP0796-20121207/89001_1 /TAXON_ID=73915 /ORGANISM="Pyrodinium bahamense, Strain pbaha01" /LENGTH=59 /DNA_ID=CAMNT_0020883491 /DNA_START=155 /DNA_END=331 /DNA_ORIENTATION=-